MNFKIISNIGKGGFGLVQLIEDDQGKRFALKSFDIHPLMIGMEDNARKRFILEVKYQKLINHPNIVPVLSDLLSNNPPAYIMPLANTSLQNEINSDTLDNDTFLNAIYDIMAGLEAIHSLGIYHRDLKPGNVLKFDDGYKISDFGLMSITETGITTLTSTGMTKGSDMYTAPEITQDLKFASVQSDIYSLGCILHDFFGQDKRLPCNEIIESSPYGDIFLGATRKDPSRRFASVASFREALSSLKKVTPKLKLLQRKKFLIH